MFLQISSFPSASSQLFQSTLRSNWIGYEATHVCSRRRKRGVSSTSACLRVGTDAIVEISHNKVLIATTVCSVVGQLVKPFTASILYRSRFDFKAAFQAGGFPSTHSSAAVASATSLGLERGFSDSIFGLAVVYAFLTMYDAQGVRREVGAHARTLNRAFSRHATTTHSSRSIEPAKFGPDPLLPSLSLSCSANDTDQGSEPTAPVVGSLKESIGHTETEVVAGALFGVLVSLAVYSV